MSFENIIHFADIIHGLIPAVNPYFTQLPPECRQSVCYSQTGGTRDGHGRFPLSGYTIYINIYIIYRFGFANEPPR